MPRLFTAIVATALLQMPTSERAAVSNYQAAIQAVESQPTEGGIERAFNALVSLEEMLTHGRGNSPSVLESLSEDEFLRLQQNLPGTRINREEVVFVKPDPDYFAKLSAARGDAADQRFFAAYRMSYSETLWPIYIEQQTDYSGCTAFGSGNLIEGYRLWSEFQSAFPNRYVAAARKELESVSRVLTESTCACGETSAVQSELQRFLQRFPISPIRARVEERLRAVQSGRSNIRARCISG